jgi:hypothetical protein
MLRRMFGPKREKMSEGWRRLHNEELHNLYASSNFGVIKSRRVRWAGHIARMREMRNAYKIFVEKPVNKRLLGRHRRRWECIRILGK